MAWHGNDSSDPSTTQLETKKANKKPTRTAKEIQPQADKPKKTYADMRLLRICILVAGWPLASGLASVGRAKRKQFQKSCFAFATRR
jgi:hypothetical protein